MLPARLTLRRHWIAFTVLITLGLLCRIFWPDPYFPDRAYQPFSDLVTFWSDYRPTVAHILRFGLLVAVTYTNWKPLWGAAMLYVDLKLYWLLAYYTFTDYFIQSRLFNFDYMGAFYKLQHISSWFFWFGGLFFGNNLMSAALLTLLYRYWLVLCWKVLREPVLKGH